MTGPVLSYSVDQIVEIMRNVTGRVDRNDPAFTQPIMIDYLNVFLQTEHPTEIRMFENRSWWDFTIDTTTPDPMTVDLDALGFSTINSPAYVSYADVSLNPNTFPLFWYESPAEFYARWPWANIYVPQQPTSVLYYNNTLTFRGPPDQEYNIRIAAYKIDLSFAGGSIFNANSTLAGTSQDYDTPRSYLIRYLAYGASLDILSDYGEMDKWQEVFQVYKRYKGQVLARTWNQFSSQRTAPDF
jgi:hypothetical protein